MNQKPAGISLKDWEVINYGKRMKQQCKNKGIPLDEIQYHITPLVYQAIQKYEMYIATIFTFTCTTTIASTIISTGMLLLITLIIHNSFFIRKRS